MKENLDFSMYFSPFWNRKKREKIFNFPLFFFLFFPEFSELFQKKFVFPASRYQFEIIQK
jgi:hypothetical protein